VREVDVAGRTGLGAAVVDVLAVDLSARLGIDAHALPQTTTETALVRSAQAFIAANLGDPDLSPRMVAQAQHISVPYLYRLFEDQSETLAAWIRQLRLDRCRSDLLDPTLRHRPGGAIGAGWGLVNAAQFSRVFSKKYGITRFLMAGAEHPTMGVSTFPFTMFGDKWAERTLDVVAGMPSRGDTVIGNDVWFGYRVTVMPGVRIGDGAIIAAGAMVTANVLPYTIVGVNPARPIRQRFDNADVARLRRAAWWDWPVGLVTEHARTIMAGTPAGTPAGIERIAAKELAPAEAELRS
jgi:AraC-like DNA-binding protein